MIRSVTPPAARVPRSSLATNTSEYAWPAATSSTPSATLQWLAARKAASLLEVRRIDFSASHEWSFTADRAALRHKTGKFFAVEGLALDSPISARFPCMQPILNQSEHGILGFLVQYRSGELHFLAQAKAEPGNVGSVQLAPTLQATESNYSQVHKGKPTEFLGRFLNPASGSVVVHQLQSEQGSRFLRKRNRNMIVQVEPGTELDFDGSFRWITMSEIIALMCSDNTVNTDARSVLASLSQRLGCEQGRRPEDERRGIQEELWRSAKATDKEAIATTDAVLAWFVETKLRLRRHVRTVPLTELQGWRVEANRIVHESGRFFR